MMRAKSLVDFVITGVACVFLGSMAHAQVGDCPNDTCVESHTTLEFNQSTHTMDAFTTASTDYTTAYWYDLCVNLAVLRVNGPYVADWDILLPSTTPSTCVSGQVVLEESGSVVATPGRQYFAEGLVELYVYYTYSDIVYDCGEYCTGYWYDAEGYSLLSTTPNPTNANWPSIEYSYPYLDEPEPVYQQSLAMTGSGATAWAPPVIYSVSPNQWPAGQTTTFTISGAGFGYGPTLSISGSGITGYTNPCTTTPSLSCDSTIIVAVTIDPNTPANSQETITVTAGGQNPSGFLPVDTGQDQQRQATAQAVTLALIAYKPYIVLGAGGGSCVGGDISGTTRSVQVGQQISFTACLPAGTPLSNVASMSWTPATPQGTAVGGYTTTNSGANSSGKKVPLSSPSCTLGQWYCTFPAFYWVDQANGRQFTFQYTLTDGSSNQASITFNVGGPTGISVAVTPSPSGVNVVNPPITVGTTQLTLPILIFGASRVKGMQFYATATNLASGSYLWVQLIQHDRLTILGSLGKTGPTDSIPGQAKVDQAYPYGYKQDGTATGAVYTTTVLNDSAQDSPFVNLIPSYGEEECWFQATMYLMWVPAADPNCNSGAACTIPVPQGQVGWSFAGDAINTLQPGINQGVSYVQWVLNPNNCSGGNPQAYQQSTAYPEWTAAINPA